MCRFYLSGILSGGAGLTFPGKTCLLSYSGQDVTWQQMLYTPLLIVQGAASGWCVLSWIQRTLLSFGFCNDLCCLL